MRCPAAVVALLPLFVISAQSTMNLGDACFYDEECETITTFCRERRVCDCKDRFREAEGRCVATVTARCSSDYECSSLVNSRCVEQECMCREGYVRQANDVSCLPVVSVFQGACEEHTQCQRSFGEWAVCDNSMCQCLDGRHFADGACWFSRGLGDACSNTTECSYAQDQRHRLHCHAGQCKCREGYRRNGNVCDDGAAQISLSVAAMVFFALRFTIL